MSSRSICFYGKIRKKISQNYHQIRLLKKSTVLVMTQLLSDTNNEEGNLDKTHLISS